ncbi:MAG: hypothetical protein NZL92_06745 [Gloeomargarita sp. SKYG116]|nr:hypothetical protein [Gloeomargarita sp. SKYG116]MDW8401376.1 hypothetical protein [Gloeomargarita sp. SKYGB_i_bin116]
MALPQDREAAIRYLMEKYKVDRYKATFIYNIETGKLPGDVINLNQLTPEQRRILGIEQ